MWQHQRLMLLRVAELMAAGRREMAMVLRIYVYIQYHTNMESVRIVLDTPVRRKMSTSVEMIRTTSTVHTVTITAHKKAERL